MCGKDGRPFKFDTKLNKGWMVDYETFVNGGNSNFNDWFELVRSRATAVVPPSLCGTQTQHHASLRRRPRCCRRFQTGQAIDENDGMGLCYTSGTTGVRWRALTGGAVGLCVSDHSSREHGCRRCKRRVLLAPFHVRAPAPSK